MNLTVEYCSVEKEIRSFCSKVLLFGEYSIIKNSYALAIPFELFSGKLIFSEKQSDFLAVREQKGQAELKNFGRYLQNLMKQKVLLNFVFDLTSFLFDVEQGLYFSSTIPQGVGLGSSGALCAALFDRYAKLGNPRWPAEGGDYPLYELRQSFVYLESFFHGTSSGIDPLLSYLGRPLLMTSDKRLMSVNYPLPRGSDKKETVIFLIDTMGPRKTGPLVNLFLEKCKNDDFGSALENELIPLTHACIESFLEGKTEVLWENFDRLSRFQLQHFRPMIPAYFQGVWQSSLEESSKLKIKLCGAGGGGFMLGITSDFEEAAMVLKDFQLRKLLVL